MKDSLNKNSIIAGLVLVVSGFIFILFSKTEWLVNVACSLLASGVVILTTALIVERIKVSPLDEWGIQKVYRSRQEMNPDCDEKNAKAKKEIDVVAFGLKHFREEFEIEPLLKRGVNLRIITMDPDSEFLPQREKEEGKTSGYIKKGIRDLVDWANALNDKNYKGRIEIRGYTSMTIDFYWRVDDTLFVGPYWYDADSQATISYCYTAGKGFEEYTQYFEKLWNNSALLKPLTRKSTR